MKVRLDSNISEVVGQLAECKTSMDNALVSVNKAKAKIESGGWTGKSKDVTAALLDLCIQFHTELNGHVAESYNVMKKLEDNANTFMSSSTHAREWKE